MTRRVFGRMVDSVLEQPDPGRAAEAPFTPECSHEPSLEEGS